MARTREFDTDAALARAMTVFWCRGYEGTSIADVVEAGDDPDVPEAYGWRFLRACLSRLTTARPRETGQHRMMRDAILSTSRLTTQLVNAHTIVRELAPRAGRR